MMSSKAAGSFTPKKEAFAMKHHECGCASEAYRFAYNAEKMSAATIQRKASELLKDGYVAARLDELRAATREKHQITVDDLLAELEEARIAALTAVGATGNPTPQSSAAVSATMGKARLLGLDKQIIEQKTTSYVVAPGEASSLEEWAAQ